MKKKILFVITKSNWGGAQKYVYDLAVNLPQDVFERAVIFGGHGALAEKLSGAGVRTISIPKLGRDVNVFGDISVFFKLISIFKKEKPDIVHVNSSKVGALGALAARIAGIRRIVFTCHGWPFNEERSSFSLFAIRFISWLTVMFSHVTITVSERDLHDGNEMPGAKDKIALVHNGIREPNFMNRDEGRRKVIDIAKERGIEINEGDFLIGAIGELHKNKAYEFALEALHAAIREKIPAKLIIIGEGEERSALADKIRELGLQKSVALLGFVKDAPSYLSAFDAFVLSSIKEGLPYVVIEAGFAGLPVVATNVGGTREIVEDMKSGILVQTRKPLDIAQGLEFFYKNPEKASQFAENLKAKVKEEFSMEKMVAKTVEIYCK